MHIALKMAKIIESLDAFDIVMETTIAMNACVCVCVLLIRQLVVLCSFSRFMRMDRSADLGVYMTYNAQQQQQQRWRCYLINATEPHKLCVSFYSVISWKLICSYANRVQNTHNATIFSPEFT